MSQEQLTDRDVHIRARNIGGIEEAEVSLSSGVTVLTGRNASNRTSFLQAIMAVLGSNQATLKGDADEGEVELRIGDETYTRTLTRSGDKVTYNGDPYLEDSTLADQFAFLLENTEVRQAVTRGEDLREIIMDPVDTAEIEAEISRLVAEKNNLDDEIEEVDRLECELPDLKAEKRDIEEDLEQAMMELSEVESKIEAHDVSLERSRAKQEEMEETLEKLRGAQSDLEDVEFDLETERQTLEDLRTQREELESRIEEIEEPEEEPEQLAGRIEELRERKRSLNDTVSQLGSVISFNEEMLSGDGLEIKEIGEQSSNDDPTEKLLEDKVETVCWTCGSEVERNRITDTIDHLRDLRSGKLDERGDLNDRIDELSSARSEIQQKRRELERLESRLSEMEAEIESTCERIESLEASLTDKREEVERLEAATENAGSGDKYQEVLDLHLRSNQIELRIERLEENLADVEERIDDHETAIDERSNLEGRREEVNQELLDLRTRVERIEEGAVEQFNDHMDTVLELLDYENLDRIWIEKLEREVREGRRKVSKSVFELHIVRSTDDGASYEDTVDHLSESEREVTGLVFALSGYLVYEVFEELPFMLLDSLEAIDSDRIARIVEYFSDYADYFTVALLPEDAQALSPEYSYVEQIG